MAELPTIWLERAQGTSNFKVLRWLPRYLKWYRFAFGPPSRARPGALDRRDPAGVTDQPNGKQVLVTGSAGFIGGYVVEELLGKGYSVVGVDDYSKYGRIAKSYDDHPRYRLIEGDATDVGLMNEAVADCDHFIAGAALIGGISYFHAFAYDLLATNERIMAASCDAAIKAHREGRLEKVTYMSSSMVFESATRGRRSRASSARSRPRSRRTGSRSSRSSTTRSPHTRSTTCRTRSAARSTASVSARCAPGPTSRC